VGRLTSDWKTWLDGWLDWGRRFKGEERGVFLNFNASSTLIRTARDEESAEYI
jgi:hypothetical protein